MMNIFESCNRNIDLNDVIVVVIALPDEERNRVLTWADYRFKSHLYLPWLWDAIVESEQLKKVARELLGSDTVVIWSTDWCVKPCMSEGHFSWHQDSTYSQFGEDALTLWIAFSDLDSDLCGPVAFKVGSQKLGQMPHVEKRSVSNSANNNMLALGQTIPEQFDSDIIDKLHLSSKQELTAEQKTWTSKFETVTACPLECGMASAHSFLTIHSSQSNRHPTRDRIGLALRLVNAEYNKPGKRPDRVTLLCGKERDVQRFGDFEKRPNKEFGEEEMKEWQLSIMKENEFYFQSSSVKQYTQ